MKRTFWIAFGVTALSLAVSPAPASAEDPPPPKKTEWHDWVGPLDWCGGTCDSGESCCVVIEQPQG